MTVHVKPTQIAIGVATGVLLAGGGYAVAQTRSPVASHAAAAPTVRVTGTTSLVTVCVNKRTRAVTMPPGPCPKGTSTVRWDVETKGPAGAKGAPGAASTVPGPRGETGAAGAAGAAGATGSPGTNGTDGTDGSSATVHVGTVTTGTAGSQASVTNSGTASNAVLDFTIPQGPAGTPGMNGTANAWGEVWPTANGGGAEFAPSGSYDTVSVTRQSTGSYLITASGCAAADPTEAAITVTTNHDSNDPADLQAGNSAYATWANWGTSGLPSHEGRFFVSVADPATDTLEDADFSFTVDC